MPIMNGAWDDGGRGGAAQALVSIFGLSPVVSDVSTVLTGLPGAAFEAAKRDKILTVPVKILLDSIRY